MSSKQDSTHLFLPLKRAIQKLEAKASMWRPLCTPGGAMKRLGQLSWYKLPGDERCKKSPAPDQTLFTASSSSSSLLYSTILHSPEQAHGACMWFCVSDEPFYSVFLNIHQSGALTALAWLVLHKTAAVSVQALCTPYNHGIDFSPPHDRWASASWNLLRQTSGPTKCHCVA